MTDINTRGKLPFTVVSSSVNTGYAAQLTSSVGYNIDLVNHHKDEYGGIENSPLQGPFTNQHVGGNQYRHVKLNEGTDNSNNRPEGYIVSASVGSVKIYGPDVKGVHKPRSLLTRDTTAKSPVNIKNIETSGNIAGNFEHNYQVVQSVGRRTTNNLINDNFIASGNLTTQFINNLLFVDDNFSSYSNGDKLTSNQYFLGDGDSEVRTETSTSDKYFVLNKTSPHHRFLRTVSPFEGKTALSYKAIVNRSSPAYDISGLNLEKPEFGEDLVLQYSYDLTTWNTIKTILTGTNTFIFTFFSIIETVEKTETIDLPGLYYLRFFQQTHSGMNNDNYAITNIRILSDNSYALPNITNNSKSIFVERFNAPGGKEVSSRAALDREGEEYAPNNSLTTRNIKVRQPFYNQLTQHSAQFNSGSTYELLPKTGSVNAVTIHGVNRNTLQKVFITGTSYFTGSKYDNFWVQHAIPRTDLRYKWIADSISSSQQPIEYQSYNLPYSTSSFYNSNGAFEDLSFELTGPFGDHLGISGAVDKDEMFVSKYTNTMYRDRKYLNFTSSNDFYVDASSIAGDISQKDFTISFWMKTSGNIPSFAVENSIFEYTSSVSVDEPDPTGLFFHPSGTYVYITGNSNNKAYQYTLSTPWDITTKLTVPVTKSLSSETIEPRGLYIKSDGTKLYIISSVSLNTEIIEYSLTTNWDISSATAPIIHPFLNDSTPRDIFFKPDGTELYIPGSEFDKIYQKHLSVPWDITSTGSVATLDVSSVTAIQGLSFSEDGKHLYLIDSSTPERIYYYYLSVPWNITTATKLSSNDLDISSRENVPTGISINERLKKLYFIGTENNNIYQYNLVEQPLSLIEYSGSTSQNKLLLNVNFSSSYLSITGSGAENTNISLPIIEDGNWHFITLVSDFTTNPMRYRGQDFAVAEPTTKTKIYVDGGLVGESEQLYKKLDVSKLLFSLGRNKEKENGQLDEIMIWDSFLEEEQINKIYRASKSEYGQRPKKYIEHKLENTNVPNPIHVYSSRIDDVSNIMFDEVGNKNATLTNYTASVNLYPQNTGIISYSTYFNGPYQGASWKSIRNAEHPITRKLTTKNTNIVSTLIPASITIYNSDASQPVVTADGIVDRIKVGSRRSKDGRILNVKESPVYINNKPLKHRFVLKGSPNNSAFELTHTYGNNLQYFANNQLNDTLGLNKIERQVYDTLFDYYNGNVDDNENPIQRLVGYTYSETVFPKPGQALLKDVRQRTDYITDEPGYGPDGYDRQLGTQRVFWRDNQEDRMRTDYQYIGSLGNQMTTGTLFGQSISALDFISSSVRLIKSPSSVISVVDLISNRSGELNSIFFHSFETYDSGVDEYTILVSPANKSAELYLSPNWNTTYRRPYSTYDINEYKSLSLMPKYVYEHSCFILTSLTLNPAELIVSSTIDLGLNRNTELLSGKKPWYDSYEKFMEDISPISKDFGNIPEFKISDYMYDATITYGGNFRKINNLNYKDNIILNKDNIENDNNFLTNQDKIKIKINAVKKLLPYNGFYPQDRSLQLVNNLKISYIDTNCLKGGAIFNEPYSGNETIVYDNMVSEISSSLFKFYKEQSFLEPLYSPGIFYNLIKSGIAVSWTIFTGSYDSSQTFTDPNRIFGFYNFKKPPDFEITFESLLDPVNGIPLSSSNKNSENRILLSKTWDQIEDLDDYDSLEASVQGFCELLDNSNPLYSLSINNFLAETINFYLKDSKLNAFISANERQFAQMIGGNTYYMDVVLKKTDNFKMIDSYSSSINENYGNMTGRYFGPCFFTCSAEELNDIRSNNKYFKTQRDPSYCIYTPPYFYGESIARISFKPDVDGQYSLAEIFAGCSIEYFNTGLNKYNSGSIYQQLAMNISSSINLLGKLEDKQQNIDPNTGRTNNMTNLTDQYRWTISTKMETPVLNFNDNEYVDNRDFLSSSLYDLISSIHPSYVPITSSGYGIGMWSGYGKIPAESEGIFIEIRESFPDKLKTYNFKSTTGSLMQVCGFTREKNKVGQIASKKEISEAIVIIPYVDSPRQANTIKYGILDLSVNDTINIENHNLFKINKRIFDAQKLNVDRKEPAVTEMLLVGGSTNNTIDETSISRMIKLMKNYVIPPNMNFLEYDDIPPFVMYISEFKSTLDESDLADIWQGLMPKIATKAELASPEKDDVLLVQNNSIFDFFHGQGLPSDVKFMIFKVKKKGEKNYYKMTANSTDDNLFQFNFQVGKKEPEYSYNWPYDYFSLIESAKIDIEIDYVSGSNNT